MRILALIDLIEGGARAHDINVLKEIAKMEHDVTLFVDPYHIPADAQDVINTLNGLRQNGVNVDYAYEMIERYLDKEYYNDINYILKIRKDVINGDLNPYKEIVKHLIDDLRNNVIDVIYDMHESIESLIFSYILGKELNKPVIKLLHNEPFRSWRWFGREYYRTEGIRGFVKDLFIYWLNRIDSLIYKRIMVSHVIKGIVAVSKVPYFYSGIDKMALRFNINPYMYKIGNAYNGELIEKYKSRNKEDFAVFFGRLTAAKGIFDLIKVARELYPNKVLIFGKFFDKRTMKLFINKAPRNIEYMGFKPTPELYNYVSRAKVLIYPSYSDSFSLVILEALALGTSVVAYDIPAIKFVYSNLKPIHMVNKGNVKGMANEALKLLNMDTEEYVKEHEDPITKEFLKLHSSWSNVAIETLDYLKTFVK